jgi:hypothetical protein
MASEDRIYWLFARFAGAVVADPAANLAWTQSWGALTGTRRRLPSVKRIRDLEASLPSKGQDRAAWIRSRPDWIEAHPKTVLVFAIIAATIIVSVGFVSARDLADLIRAAEGR